MKNRITGAGRRDPYGMLARRRRNLTEQELPALPEPFNLTDGHVHQLWSDRQLAIIKSLSQRFLSVSREHQQDLEAAFLQSFYGLAKQSVDGEHTKYLLCHSASMAIEIVANYLRLHHLDLTLIEPAFDNLADIYKRHGVALHSLPDRSLASDAFPDALKNVSTRAIAIVAPNNPTGTTISRQNFELLLDFSRRNRTLLVIDCSFRFFDESFEWDQYSLLNDAGIEYVVIEDTGKTWPTHELKIGILAASTGIASRLSKIHTDFILHVSPFTLSLLTSFIDDSIGDDLRHVRGQIAANRKKLYEELDGTFLQPVEEPFMSLSWAKIHAKTSAAELVNRLEENGVHVLSGYNFFWDHRWQGAKYIRIALARDPSAFRGAAERLGAVIRTLE
ncbi:MAG: pyridoxal phosphate-dependent aminotransferase [Dehalococcoidia bacterium]